MQVEKTNVIKNTLNPVWNERKWLLVQVRAPLSGGASSPPGASRLPAR